MALSNTLRTVSYVTLALGVLVLATGLQWHVLPSGLARQVGHNSEAICFALLACLSIDFLRPWSQRSDRPWIPASICAALFCILGWALTQTPWPPSVVTLNEALIGAGFLLVYISIPRPFTYWPVAFLAVLAFIVLFFDTSVVLNQAESLVPLLIAPISLDFIDRCILEEDYPDRPVRRLCWMATLTAIALGFAALAPSARANLDSGLALAIDYGHRAAEAYWGWILIHAYFALARGLKGSHQSTAKIGA